MEVVLKVYLAGPINACSDDEVTSWRAEARTHLEGLGYEILDPADRDFRGVENETFESIVEGDKADIGGCNVMLAYCWQPSYGTAMEIIYAWEHNISVVAVVPEGKPISPWVQYHAESVHRTLLDGLNAVPKRT